MYYCKKHDRPAEDTSLSNFIPFYECPECKEEYILEVIDRANAAGLQTGKQAKAKCTTDRFLPVHNIWHAPAPRSN